MTLKLKLELTHRKRMILLLLWGGKFGDHSAAFLDPSFCSLCLKVSRKVLGLPLMTTREKEIEVLCQPCLGRQKAQSLDRERVQKGQGSKNKMVVVLSSSWELASSEKVLGKYLLPSICPSYVSSFFSDCFLCVLACPSWTAYDLWPGTLVHLPFPPTWRMPFRLQRAEE